MGINLRTMAIMKRIWLPVVLLLSSCGKPDAGPANREAREVIPTPVAAATPAARDPVANITTSRQILARLQFRRPGQPQVTQKQIDTCLGPGYSLVIDRITRARGPQPETHTLYLKIPKTASPANLVAKLQTLEGVEHVRLR